MAVRRHFQGAMVPGWAGLGLGIRQTWHRQDRPWGGYAIGSSPSKRSTFGIFGSSFNITPPRGVDRLLPPSLPSRRGSGGNTANGTLFLFLLFFPLSGLYKQKSEGAGRTFLSAHRTHSNVSRQTTHSFQKTKDFLCGWIFGFPWLYRGQPAGNLSTNETKTKGRGGSKKTERDGDVVSRLWPASRAQQRSEQAKQGGPLMDAMDARNWRKQA